MVEALACITEENRNSRYTYLALLHTSPMLRCPIQQWITKKLRRRDNACICNNEQVLSPLRASSILCIRMSKLDQHYSKCGLWASISLPTVFHLLLSIENAFQFQERQHFETFTTIWQTGFFIFWKKMWGCTLGVLVLFPHFVSPVIHLYCIL